MTSDLVAFEGGSPSANRSAWRRLKLFLAIVGPGLIVMAGDNDAGAFGTYTQTGQNYGTALLWTLVLLVPVLYVNQEMVLRLGAVTGVGHARLIFARFGRFWGAFSALDLLILNALTIVTEFIGISLALDYFGLSKVWGVGIAAILVMLAAAQGTFKRFERFCLLLCLGSVFLIPVLVAAHASLGTTAHDLFVPGMPAGSDPSAVVLLICAIVGTTVAPWQLFFQQSFVIDKRITPRYIAYERWDLVVGIALVLFGAVAMMSFAAATFAGHVEFGRFQDAGAVASGIAKYVGRVPAACFCIALIDASLIGAAAVSLSTAYAVGDVFALEHSLDRSVADAPVFYGVYAALVAIAAAIVLVPGTPLGLLTSAVQVLAGVLLPSATVFLLLLCNDEQVLGPWVNGIVSNVVTGVVIAMLVALSVILTASTLFPEFGIFQIVWTLSIGALAAIAIAIWFALAKSRAPRAIALSLEAKRAWRMAPIAELPEATLSLASRVWLLVLRAYLAAAVFLVVYKVALIALKR
jgi:Mn2+/Fe2+ NRAMP family transporter